MADIKKLKTDADLVEGQKTPGGNTKDLVGGWMINAAELIDAAQKGVDNNKSTIEVVKATANAAIPKTNISQTIGQTTDKVPSEKAVFNALSSKASVNEISEIYHDLGVLNDDKIDKTKISQKIGQSTSEIMSQKAVTDLLFDNNNQDKINIGKENSVRNNDFSIVIGQDNHVLGDGAVMIGLGGSAVKNSVALGWNSMAEQEGVVSVGNDDIKRRIVNVATPKSDSDATTKEYVDLTTKNKLVSTWNEVFRSYAPVTLYDGIESSLHRPSFLPETGGAYNILPFSSADGESSFLMYNKSINKAYIYDPAYGEYVQIGDISEMERRFLSGDYLIPLTATGNSAGIGKLQIMTTEDVMITISGSGRFYSNAQGTQNESRVCFLTAEKITDVYVKVPYGMSYINIPKGLSIIKKLGSGYAGPLLITADNSPAFEINSTYFPLNLATLSLHQVRASGEVKLSDFPAATTVFGYSYGNATNKVKLSGNLADIKSKFIEILYAPGYQNNNMTGDIAELINRKVVLMHINSSKGFTYTSSVKPISHAIRGLTIDTLNNTTWTSAMTDSFLQDMSTATFESEKIIKLMNLAPRTSASDNAVSILQSKGVTVTV